ncbi:MAG: hypothetical protein ACWGOY_13780 [Anaerolineales bacterium]
MCYSIYLSTDSDRDLRTENDELVRFRKGTVPESYRSLLRYKHHWYVGSKSGCSCTFRHLSSIELGFMAPVDWYEEGEHEILATAKFIKFVRRMKKLGYQVDCIDTWEGVENEEIVDAIVNLDEITDDQFRFFENHHFIFEGGLNKDQWGMAN